MISNQKILAAIQNAKKQPLIVNMLTVGIITFFVKILAFYKETLVASTFGLSELLDTFFIAILIPSFVQNVFVTALKNLFIPNYLTEIKESGNKRNFQAVSFFIITVIVAVLTLFILLFAFFFLELVFPDHTFEYYNSIKNQLYIILPCLILWGYGSLLGGLLEIESKFIVTSFSPIFATLTTIICLLFFKSFFGEMVMAYSILLGSIFGFLFLLYFTWHQKLLKIGSLIANDNVKLMVSQLRPKIISGFLTGINPFVDQFFAAQLAIGSITAIKYGVNLPQVATGIVIIALGNVLLPHFSKIITQDMDKAFRQLFQILKILFISTAVLVVIGIFFSDEIVALLFERNEFKSKDTIIVSNIQKIVLIYVPFFLCTLVLVKFLTSINKNGFMAWVSFWNLILNLVLNYLLMDRFGVYGLVLSTTLVYIVCFLIYLNFTIKEYKKLRPTKK